MEKIIITIGRQFGSGGQEIAKEISAKTGIPVYDNSLLVEAAKAFGYDPEIFKQRDEKKHLFSFSRLFSTSTYNAPNYMGDNMLFQMQCEAIKKIAAEGSCIIVGRCADYVLRDMPELLSIFIQAPMDSRVKRIMERRDLGEDAAIKLIEQEDRIRKDFYDGYTLGNWGDAATYNLCIDSSVLGIEGTAEMVIDYMQKVQQSK